MKLAPIETRRAATFRPVFEEPQVFDKFQQKTPLKRTTSGSRIITVLLLVLVGLVFTWYRVLEPKLHNVGKPVERVPRAQQVVAMEPNSVLRVGETIFFPSAVVPTTATVAALPLESIRGRDNNGVERLVILGADSYCVIASDGVGHIIGRAEIRGIVRSQL